MNEIAQPSIYGGKMSGNPNLLNKSRFPNHWRLTGLATDRHPTSYRRHRMCGHDSMAGDIDMMNIRQCVSFIEM